MNPQKISTTVLRELLKLTERKETLLKELEKIESQILSRLKGNSLSNIPPLQLHQKHRNGTATRKRAPRGSMQKKIFEALAAAGPLGMKIPDLSKKIGTKSANVHVWFSNIGKRVPEIERISPGHFRLIKTN